jgi:ABC-type glycerol-3-phosphate transport system substrate-binding protein
MRTKLTVTALALFGLVLAGTPAFAQDAKVTIPFAFTVMGKTLPAGVYQFTAQTPDVIKLESVSVPGLQVELPVLERLSDEMTPGNAKVVFDRNGRTSALTQVWLDGDDGFVVYMPKH